MDLISGMQIVARRWYVFVPGLLLTGLMVFTAWTLVTPHYKATGSLLLHNPALIQDPKTGKANPYSNYNSLQIPARVVVDVLDQPVERSALAKQGATGDFELLLDPTGATPILTIVSTADTDSGAIRTLDLAMERYDEILQERQEILNAPRKTLVTTEVVTNPTSAVPLQQSRIRAVIIAAALGLGLSVGLAFAVEGLVRHRRRKNSSPEAAVIPQPTGSVSCPLCGGTIWAHALVEHLDWAHGLQNGDSVKARRLVQEHASAEPSPPDGDHRGAKRRNPSRRWPRT